MQVPFFTLSNYTDIMNTSYEENSGIERVSFRELLDLWQYNFLTRFADLDARQLSAYLSDHTLQERCTIGQKNCTLGEALIASKLLMPTIHAANYFSWKTGNGEHRGIDLMMPRGTPLMSFTEGTVTRIKQRDGSTKNEGNCVVITTPDNHAVCYEHLETINVEMGQLVDASTMIGRCGTTGNSTQYHLHLQIDTQQAPFHPYRDANPVHLYTYTVDPLAYLRNRSPIVPFFDLPFDLQEQQAILWLTRQGIIKGFANKCFPEHTIERYEMALLMDRVLKKEYLYGNIPSRTTHFTPYTDVSIHDPELDQALIKLQKYGIMKGHKNKFYPHKHLKGEELLAILGRIFFNLEDSPGRQRWTNYEDTFVKELLISSTRGFIRKDLPRKEVFLLLWRLLQRDT